MDYTYRHDNGHPISFECQSQRCHQHGRPIKQISHLEKAVRAYFRIFTNISIAAVFTALTECFYIATCVPTKTSAYPNSCSLYTTASRAISFFFVTVPCLQIPRHLGLAIGETAIEKQAGLRRRRYTGIRSRNLYEPYPLYAMWARNAEWLGRRLIGTWVAVLGSYAYMGLQTGFTGLVNITGWTPFIFVVGSYFVSRFTSWTGLFFGLFGGLSVVALV